MRKSPRHNCICKICGSSFYRPPSQIAKGQGIYCSKKCEYSDPIYRERMKAQQQHRPRASEITKKKIAIAMKGKRLKEKNPNWKGGMYALRKLVQNRPEYWQWRAAVFKRDNFRDWYSGCQGGTLSAHHIISFSTIIERNKITTIEDAMNCKELFDVNNGITMLSGSHRAHHDMWGTAEA